MIEMIKASTCEMKNNKIKIPEALLSYREKEVKKEPIEKMDKFNLRLRKKFNNSKSCRICNAPNWSPIRNCPAFIQTCDYCGKKGHFARPCRQRENYKNKLRNVTETEIPIGEENDESQSSIYRIERVNRIIDRIKYLTTTVEKKRNGKIIDNNYQITNNNNAEIEKLLKETENQKLKHRYQDVNTNEIKIRGNTGRH